MTIRRPYKIILLVLLLITALVSVRYFPRVKLTDDILYSKAVYGVDDSLLRLTVAKDGVFRLYTPLNEISPSFVDATIFYEDRYFRQHPGVNPVALIRGFYTSYIQKQRMMGASTITMQLVRKLYSIDSTTIGGKLRQMALAVWVELRYSKDDILEAYLNITPYGHNIEGVGAASLIYYNKRSELLSRLESFTLAVIPQNPVKRLPTSENGWQELVKARDNIVKAWAKADPQREDILHLLSLPMEIHTISELPYKAPHFVDGVIKDEMGSSAEIFTTLDLGMQTILETRIKNFVFRNQHMGIYNASAMLLDTKTMNVLAAVGSANFFNSEIHGQVDGTRAMRSPGSVLKPFIYGLAVDNGLIHPLTMLKDSPKRYGLYSPENSDKGFMGPIFAQDSLNHSRNIPAVDLMIQLPDEQFLKLLQKIEVKGLRGMDFYGASLALGGAEVSMEDIATLYATLNNQGEIRSVVKIKGAEPILKGFAFSKEAAFITRDMMRNNPSPRIYNYTQKLTFPVGWKTGTSYKFKDGWTAAIFGEYVLVTWVGNFAGEGNAAFMGRYSAAPLAFEIIQQMKYQINIDEVSTDGIYDRDIPIGLNVKYVDVCAITGELPTDFCPRIAKTLFIPGVSPIKRSDIFRQIPIDIDTGLRACKYDPNTTRMEVYEFWQSDILDIFEKAGIKKKTIPRYLPNCELEDTLNYGTAPQIKYPQSGVLYDMSNTKGDMELPLSASISGDAEKVFWFIDNYYLGDSYNGEPFYWKAKLGKHQLQAVDNLGRSSLATFEVI